MAYTAPKTWTNEPLVASDLNTHVRDNMEALKDPPSSNYELDEGSDYQTTSTSFVPIDSTNLKLSITTTGGDVVVHFHGVFDTSVGGTNRLHLEIEVDGTPLAGDDGVHATQHQSGGQVGVSFTRLITGLDPGSHTFELHWKTQFGTETLYAGAGTSGMDVHPQFWAREVS